VGRLKYEKSHYLTNGASHETWTAISSIPDNKITCSRLYKHRDACTQFKCHKKEKTEIKIEKTKQSFERSKALIGLNPHKKKMKTESLSNEINDNSIARHTGGMQA